MTMMMTTNRNNPVAKRPDYTHELWSVEDAFHRMVSASDRGSRLLWALRLTRAKKALAAARAN